MSYNYNNPLFEEIIMKKLLTIGLLLVSASAFAGSSCCGGSRPAKKAVKKQTPNPRTTARATSKCANPCDKCPCPNSKTNRTTNKCTGCPCG